MKKSMTYITNILLLLATSFVVFFMSFFFSYFPLHGQMGNGLCDMSALSFDSKAHYPLCNEFIRTSFNEETMDAVYECTVLLPEDVFSVALRVPPVDATNDIYINDTLVLHRKANKTDTLFNTPRVVTYNLRPEDNHSLHIVLLVTDPSKYFTASSLSPLAYRDFLIGSVSGLYFFQNLFVLFDVVLISICVIAVVFHFICFLYRDTAREHLFFSLLALSGIVGLLFSNQRSITFLFKSIPLEIGTKILILGYFLRLFSLLELENVAFNNLSRRKTLAVLRVTNYILPLIFLLLPIPYVFYAQPIYFVLTAICIMLAINEGIRSYQYEPNVFTRVMLIGYIFLFVGSFSDITHVLGINKAYSTFYAAQILFILLQSIITSIQYTNSLKTNQRLSVDLKQRVFNLQNNKNTYISTHIDPKYIYNTLSLVEKNIDQNQDKVDMLIQSLSKYLRHTFDYDVDSPVYSYKKELELCYAMANIITTKSPHIKIEFNIEENLPDVKIPMFSLAALIDNALTYSLKGTLHPTISISIKNTGKFVEFSSYDNGIGMTRNDIDYVLGQPHVVVAYGLYQINQVLIDKCQTNLNINSKVNRYTIVSFLIPVAAKEDE